MASELLTARHWIGGAWIDSPNRRNSINPATGEVIGTYADGGPAEASQAIRVARQAFLETDWRESRRLRARALNEMASTIGSRFPTRCIYRGTGETAVSPRRSLFTSLSW